MDSPTHYSISIRLQRTTTEYAFVRVPVNDETVKLVADGTFRVDPEKMMVRARDLGQLPSVTWYFEGQDVCPHPIQKAPEPNEQSL